MSVFISYLISFIFALLLLSILKSALLNNTYHYEKFEPLTFKIYHYLIGIMILLIPFANVIVYVIAFFCVLSIIIGDDDLKFKEGCFWDKIGKAIDKVTEFLNKEV